jgi:hypothetical protein
VREKTAIIRNMKIGTQVTVPFANVVDEVVKRIGKENLDIYNPKDPI